MNINKDGKEPAMPKPVESMTGFGAGRVESDGLIVTAEAKSVNGRYLDINCYMPYSSLEMETVVENIVREKIRRGNVKLVISVEGVESTEPDVERLSRLAESVRKIMDFLEIDEPLRLSDLSVFPGLQSVFSKGRDVVPDDLVAKAAENAVNALIAMRRTEGAAMVESVRLLLSKIGEAISRAEKIMDGKPDEKRKKLLERLEELMLDNRIDKNRIEQEVAIYADRIDVREEIARLESHLEQAREVLDSGGVIGRKLDFLSQEILRELNTVSAKSNDTEVVKLCLEAKEYSASIKEIIRNIQ